MLRDDRQADGGEALVQRHPHAHAGSIVRRSVIPVDGDGFQGSFLLPSHPAIGSNPDRSKN